MDETITTLQEMNSITDKTGSINDIINTVIDYWSRSMEENKQEGSFEFLSTYIDEMKGNLKAELERVLIEKEAHGVLPSQITILDKVQDIKKLTKEELILVNIDLSNRVLDGINLDDKILINVSANHTKFNDCRFRKTSFLFCDLRYAEVNGGTFEGANIWWCDLYRAYFQGVVRFANSTITNSSINNTYFAGGALIRKMNFKGHTLLQEDKEAYRRFLVLWDSMRPSSDKIRNDDNKKGDLKIDQAVSCRYSSLELIYKNLSSSFSANGFSNDSNWGFVMGKISERKVLIHELSWKELFSKQWKSQLKKIGKICANWLYDKAFGYGESLVKIVTTYLVIVFFFTFIYMYRADIGNFLQALIISFKNMVGISSPELESKQDFVLNLLNLIQTTIGILTTGIFGFILGNKIRNQ